MTEKEKLNERVGKLNGQTFAMSLAQVGCTIFKVEVTTKQNRLDGCQKKIWKKKKKKFLESKTQLFFKIQKIRRKRLLNIKLSHPFSPFSASC